MAVLDRSSADDILTSTLDNIRDTLTEQWVTANPVTKKLFDAGKVREQNGGNQIVENIEYQQNNTSGWVSSSAVVSVSINQILKQATYQWAVLAGSVGIDDHEDAKNSGNSAMFNLLKVRTANLRNTFNEDLETALVGQTTPNTDTLWSLIDVIDSSDPSIANYGNIDRDTFTFWQATETASGSMATQGLEDIRTAYYTTGRARTDAIDMHITTQTLYEAYQARLQPQERLGKQGDLEFEHLLFANKPIFFSEDMTSGVWLGLNTKYTNLVINSAMKFKNQPFTRVPGGQSKSAVVQLMVQLTSSRIASHFKLTGMTA